MTAIFKHWLKTQLIALKQVRNCYIDPPDRNITFVRWHPDILVRTWTGKAAAIHIFDQQPKSRKIRDIARFHTENGTPCLFIVDIGLLPNHGARLQLPQWLQFIHDLTSGRVYAYALTEETPQLYQMHFTATGRHGEYSAEFGEKVEIGDIRFNRLWFKDRPLKGEWLIMLFGDGHLWKEPQQRAEFTEEAKHWQPGYTPQANGALAKSYTLLGIEPGTPHAEVKSAYRRLALKFHPDTSKLPLEEAEARFRELTEAYEALCRANGWT